MGEQDRLRLKFYLGRTVCPQKEESLAKGNNNVVLGAGSQILLRNSPVSQHSEGKTSPRYGLEGGGVRML